MAGNKLGKRKYYKYTSDTGGEYSYLTDIDLATAAGAVADASFPGFPRRFKPRVVYMQATDGAKKKVICPTLASTLYDSDTTQDITIDTVVFKTTGRAGEKMSFASNPA